MFLHIGDRHTLCMNNIICILSAEEIWDDNKKFLTSYEKNERMRYVVKSDIRSYILTTEGFIYCSQINSKTLKKRLDDFYEAVQTFSVKQTKGEKHES